MAYSQDQHYELCILEFTNKSVIIDSITPKFSAFGFEPLARLSRVCCHGARSWSGNDRETKAIENTSYPFPPQSKLWT